MENFDERDMIYNRISALEDWGGKEYIIYPFGHIGKLTKKVLNEEFGIQEKYLIDNNLSGEGIYHIDFLREIDVTRYYILVACNNFRIYDEIITSILKYVSRYQLIELFPRIEIGKYSYGPLLEQWWGIESIGAFCSFAQGTAIAGNHDVYISSHPFLSHPGCYSEHPGYMPGIVVAKPQKGKKTKIGNDVWVGRNAIIIAGCNIGNGVIIGAGAVVTKDIPDYAVAVGVPARIMRYRYLPEQIEKMNKIAWWDWKDEKIKENYMDFYLDINEFIEKHYNEVETINV